jgi:hypothetical protein
LLRQIKRAVGAANPLEVCWRSQAGIAWQRGARIPTRAALLSRLQRRYSRALTLSVQPANWRFCPFGSNLVVTQRR